MRSLGQIRDEYQQVQPRVKALCEKYDIPYVQESLFKRFVKLWKILLGVDSMRIADTTGSAEPARAEPSTTDAADWNKAG